MFRSVLAASLPLLVGVIAIVGTFLRCSCSGSITDVSIFSINLTTALGLGLAIDYSLFIVSRFREELRRRPATPTTPSSAPSRRPAAPWPSAPSPSPCRWPPCSSSRSYFLRSFAYAGIAVVLRGHGRVVVVAAGAAGRARRRVDAWRVRRRAAAPTAEAHGFWHRIATAVMRRPVPIATVVIALLLVLGPPFLRVDVRPARRPGAARRPPSPPGRPSILRADFDGERAPRPSPSCSRVADDRRALDAYAADGCRRSTAWPGSTRRPARTSTARWSRPTERRPASASPATTPAPGFSVVPTVEPISARASSSSRTSGHRRAVRRARGRQRRAAASTPRTRSSTACRWRWPSSRVATFVLLFLMIGSVLVPVKALVLNLLSA